MSLFWIGAAGLALLAWLMLWSPLVLVRRSRGPASARRENLTIHRERLRELEAQLAEGQLSASEAEALRAELDRSLLIDASEEVEKAGEREPVGRRWLAPLVLSVCVPLSAWLMYDRLGAVRDWQLAREIDAIAAEPDPARRDRQIGRLVIRLEDKLERDPDDTTARYLQARTLMELGRYPEAVASYAELARANPEAPRILAEYAQARYAASDRVLGPETADILRRVVALDPGNQMALGLLGLGAFHHENYAEAVHYWEQALAATRDPAGQQALQAGIDRARERMGLAPADNEAEAGPRIEVRVSLGPAPVENLAGNEVVFVFARPAGGPKMPLAAVRLPVGELPASVVLDDSQAMMPSMKLSTASGPVEVLARLSRSGQPVPQSGDWQSEIVTVRPGEVRQPVALRIAEPVP